MSLETEQEQLLRDIERLETRLEQLRNGLIRDAYFTLREMQRSDHPRPVYRRSEVFDED